MNTITTKDSGEVTRYIGCHGTKRVAKFVLVCAAMPLAATVTWRKRT
jgi:hypothetical protein